MKLRGVNLGGWLLLEKWITPSVFEGLQAEDEYSFCSKDVQDGYKRLQFHRDNFITKKDFKWLAQAQFNAVRLPIGYWALKDDKPFVNCQDLLDKAFNWASELGLNIILDLHGAPGSQNGLDHSGKAGAIDWTNGLNMAYTIDVLDKLAERYGNQQALWGISLINEPGWDVPLDLLHQFYINGYETIRQHCDARVAVIISDSFRPKEWNNFMDETTYNNVVLDIHLYQCFSAYDKSLTLEEHIIKTKTEWSRIIEQSNKPVVIGEWSLGLDPNTFADMNEYDKAEAITTYANAQLNVFNKAAGWFFWTYKTEGMVGWNVQDLMDSDMSNLV